MTATAWILLAVAGAVAAVDWIAVARRPSRIEYVAKPAVMVALLGAALALDPVDHAQRWWFVAALVLSLAGDVFLLPKPDAFVAGLGSFLLAHVAYIAGFAQVGEVTEGDLMAVSVVLIPIAAVAFVVHGAVLRTDPSLRIPVLLYIAVIAAMVAWSIVAGDAIGIAGAALFATSDSVLALNRFHRQWRHAGITVMITYHVAQVLLVVSLA